MRTKNLNLKKKIAFIASVAMIATTATYLPAGSLTASAVNMPIAGATVNATVPVEFTVATNEADNTSTKIDTFHAFVKVDGKYLATDNNGNYKLFSSMKNLDTDYALVDALKNVTFNDENAYKVWTGANNKTPKNETVDTDAERGAYDKATVQAGTKIVLPYNSNANAEYALEFVSKKKATLQTGSQTELEFKLDEHGMYKVPVTKKSVKCATDNSNWDNDDKLFAGAAATGVYEEFNFSGLEFEMEQLQAADMTSGDFTQSSAKVTTNKTGAATDVALNNGGDAYFKPVTDNAAIDAKKTYADSYKVMKVGNVFATVMTGTLASEVLPGESVTVETGLYTNGWSLTGVNNKQQIIMSMGNDGYAKSGLVTATKSGTTEYFVFVVKNPGDKMNAAATHDAAEQAVMFKTTSNAAMTGSLWTDRDFAADDQNRVEKKVGSETIKNVDNKQFVTTYKVFNNDKTRLTAGTTQDFTLTGSAVAGDVTYGAVLKTGNASTPYAGGNVWTVTAYLNGAPLNAATEDVTLTGAETTEAAVIALKTGTITTAVNTALTAINAASPKFILPEATYGATEKTNNGTANTVDAGDVWTVTATLDGATVTKDVTVGSETSKDDVIETAITAGFDDITLKTETAGNYESPIIAVKYASGTSYIRVNFSTDYNIEWQDGDDKTHPGKADGETGVSDYEITKPADIDKKGFEFKGWKIGNKDIFKTAAGDTQLVNKATTNANKIITPNATLTPVFEGLRYNVVLDANGGYIESNGQTDLALSDYKTFNGESKGTVGTFTNLQRNLENTDIEKYEVMGTGAGAVKTGYTFKGWSTTKGATVAMDEEEFEEAFPGSGETLKLYAVYSADDSINYTFREINIDKTTGNAYGTDGVADEVDNAVAQADPTITAEWDAWNDTDTATFDNSSDAMKTGVAGEKLGTLPTPVKKGYEFEGWYVKYVDSITKVISAKKVTADTVLNDDVLKRDDDGAIVSPHQVDLYAKFVQKSYKIDFDLNGGSWTDAKYDEEDSNKPVSYKYFDDEFKVYNAQGGIVFSTVNADNKKDAFAATPQIGSNDFKEFKGWTIGTSTSKISSANLYSEIQKIVNTGDLTIKANYSTKAGSSTQAGIYLNANGGGIYYADMDTTTEKPKSFGNGWNDAGTVQTALFGNKADTAASWALATQKIDAGVSINGGTPGSNVAALWTAKTNSDTIISVADKTNAIVVARPGYTFTGWYSDAACTTPYTFANYPAAGKEDIVYAGWKANPYTRYLLAYDLFSADGTVQTTDDNGDRRAVEGYTFTRTRTGETGTIADASKIGKLLVKEGQGTTAVEKTYVYSTKLSDKDKAKAEIKATYDETQLSAGNFVEDADKYVTVFGRFVPEGTEPASSDELGKATNVKGTANGKKVTISFTAADNAVKYQVCKIVNGKKYYTAKTDATSIDISPATTDYQVYVIAFDKDGKSTHSETIKLAGVPKSTLGTVKNPKVTESLEGDKKIGTVTWDAVEGATWYKVFKVVNGKTYWGSKVTENKYVFKDLPKDSSYIIYVAAGDDKGNVTYGARTKISKYPAVQNVKISADKKTVTFDKAEGAVNYQVAKLINGKTYYGTKSTSNSITMENAAKSGTQIFVLAFFTGDDGKTYSSYSQSITVE